MSIKHRHQFIIEVKRPPQKVVEQNQTNQRAAKGQKGHVVESCQKNH